MTFTQRPGSKRKGATQQSTAVQQQQQQQQQKSSKKQKQSSSSSSSKTRSSNDGDVSAKKKHGVDSTNVLTQVEPTFDEIASKPEELLLASTDIHQKSVGILKALYDYGMLFVFFFFLIGSDI